MQVISSAEVRSALLERREIALLDVREEAFHAEGHPLFAANLALSRLELDAYMRLPRKTVSIVLFDDGEEITAIAAERLKALGYKDVSVLQGGLRGWRNAGYEVFRDVNSPSKAFGELVETKRSTPSLSAMEVLELIEKKADIVIVDARRYEEFQTMSIPTGISAPGGELVFRLQELAKQPTTQVIVNCAGRTRSIIGTQSLINAGLPNKIVALRNGTIGWKLAEQQLTHGASSELPLPDEDSRKQAAIAARRVADSAKVRRTSIMEVEHWKRQGQRTIYCFDVRTPMEYREGHLRQFRSAPGGQLVQETDMFAPVRGARIVLADDDGTRANMSASWLAQMDWEVYVLDNAAQEPLTKEQDNYESLPMPVIPISTRISPQYLWAVLLESGPTVLDFSPSRAYLKGHIAGAMFVLRSYLREALEATSNATHYVITASETIAAQLAWNELRQLTTKPLFLLEGANQAWQSAGYPFEAIPTFFISEPKDYYRRPYEGTDASPEAMQNYLAWEAGLVAQLERDNTHHFQVLDQPSLT